MRSGVATVTLNRPERKNPLTFESYAELRDTFRELVDTREVKCVVLTGAGGNFCSGGDVHEIIGPLTKMDADGLLEFTRMTGDLVRAMRACPQPIVAAVEGVCAGAGAILAMASDLRLAAPNAKTAFLFTRVGLVGRRHGRLRDPAADHRPRPRRRIAVHRAQHERRGRPRLGLLQSPCPTTCSADAQGARRATSPAARRSPTSSPSASSTRNGPSRSRSRSTWRPRRRRNCMATNDFKRAYEAFAAKRTPEFKGD